MAQASFEPGIFRSRVLHSAVAPPAGHYDGSLYLSSVFTELLSVSMRLYKKKVERKKVSDLIRSILHNSLRHTDITLSSLFEFFTEAFSDIR